MDMLRAVSLGVCFGSLTGLLCRHVTHNHKLPGKSSSTTDASMSMNQMLDLRQTKWKREINWDIHLEIERCNKNEADSLRFTATNNLYKITFGESPFNQGVNDQDALIEFESIPDGKKIRFPLKPQFGYAFFHVKGNKIIFEYELSGERYVLPREWECDSYNVRWKGLSVEDLRIVTFKHNKE